MRAHRGFSLIEIIVSIFIVGVMLIVLQAAMRSAALAQVAQNRNLALSIANNELEALRSGGYDSLPASGTFSDNLLGSLPIATTSVTVSDYDEKTKEVSVSVSWQDSVSTASSTVSLTTLIVQSGGLP